MNLRDTIKRNYWVLFFLVVSLCAFLIFYQHTTVPNNLTFDEIEFSKLALSLQNKPYTPYSAYATGHSTLYFYIVLFSFSLLGITKMALRFPSAIFGLLNAGIIFIIFAKVIRKWGIRRQSFMYLLFPLSGAFFFLSNRWYFNFARFGFEATFILFLELISLLFLLFFLDHHQKKYLFGSGIFAGLAYNSYQPGRIFFLLPLFILCTIFLERKKTRDDFYFFSKKTAAAFAAFLIPFILCILPLTIYFSHNKDIRMNQLFYPANTEMSIQEKIDFFVQNLKSTTLMFTYKGDVNGRHNYPNKPALNPVLSVLFISGLILSLKDFRKKMNYLFLFYFCIAVIPTLFTYPWENPNMLRTITALPSIAYFCSYSLYIVYTHLTSLVHRYHYVYIVVTVLIMMISAVYDIRTYFVYQKPVFDEAFEATHPLQYYISNPHVDPHQKDTK